MAKYIGLISSDARGKLGGLILSRARSATTLKAHVAPRQAQTIAQATAKTTMARAQTAWRLLSAAERTTWTSYASTQQWANSLGSTYAPTGLMLWVQAWCNSLHSTYAPPATFPTSWPTPTPVVSVTFNISQGNIVNAQTGSGSQPPYWLLYGTRPIPLTRNYIRSLSYKFLGVSRGSYQIDIGESYQAAFGVVGTPFPQFAARVVNINPYTGLSTAPLFFPLAPQYP